MRALRRLASCRLVCASRSPWPPPPKPFLRNQAPDGPGIAPESTGGDARASVQKAQERERDRKRKCQETEELENANEQCLSSCKRCSLCTSVCVHLSVCASLCLSVFLLGVCLFVSICDYSLFVYVCVCLCVHMSLSICLRRSVREGWVNTTGEEEEEGAKRAEEEVLQNNKNPTLRMSII